MKMCSIAVLAVSLLGISASATDRKFVLNREIEPCHNFYQHVCSKEIQSYERPSYRSRATFYFADAFEGYLPKVSSFLVQLNKEKNPSPRAELIRNFYNACVDRAGRVEEENAVSRKVVNEVQGLKTREEFLKYAAESFRSGQLTWVSVQNEALLSDPKKWRIQVGVNWTTMPEKSYYRNEETLKDLNLVITNFFKAIRFEGASERAKGVVDLEVKIASAMPSAAERDALWNTEKYWSRNEFIKKYPLLSKQANANALSPKIPLHRYAVPLYDLVEKTLRGTDLQVLKDFLLVRLLISKLDFSQPEWSAQYWDFKSKRLGGAPKRRPLDQECSRIAQDELGPTMALEMTKSLFGDYPRKEFTELVKSLRAALLREIENNKWLTPEGRKNVLKKVRTLRMALLFPEKDEDWRFAPIGKLHANRFLENLSLVNQAYQARTLTEIQKPRNTNAWTMSPLEFDAYYVWTENRFYFPAAFAFDPIFNAKRERIENIGGIGTYIGHELGHALDKYGSQFDEFGLKKAILKNKDKEKFDRFTKGFVEQFNQIGHNGVLTLAENLADHVGVRTAFSAAFPQKVDVDQQKKFFVSYARLWCTSMSDEYRDSHLKEDTHALPEARVNEQLKHMPEFAAAFQCAPESAMVLPESKRMRIW